MNGWSRERYSGDGGIREDSVLSVTAFSVLKPRVSRKVETTREVGLRTQVLGS